MASAAAPAWHARGATLTFLALFALRNALALAPADADTLWGAVVARLGDALAALSGAARAPAAAVRATITATFTEFKRIHT